jgi:hypothetical protein
MTTAKCPCGRDAATHAENPKAFAAVKCSFCYEFAVWALNCIKRPEDCRKPVVVK